jgi:hypothetical protein
MAVKRGKTRHKDSKTARHAVSHAVSHPGSKPAGKKFFEKPELIEETIARAPHEIEEEIFVPSPVHRGKFAIPLGIKFLIGYLVFISVLYLVSFIYGITFPTTILFGQMFTGTRALLLNSVLLVLIFFMIYGFWKRKSYTFDLSVGFFSFSALNAFISLLLFESLEHPAFRKLLLLSFVSLILMNIVVVWYILHEKKYFYVERFKDRPLQHRDKVFLYTIITFWVVTLMIGLTIGLQFYKDTTRMVDSTLREMRGDYYRGQLLCEEKSGPERDVCTLVVATAMSAQQRPQAEIADMCDTIKSDFYRFTCMRSIAR